MSAGIMKVQRMLDLAFFPGRAPRSPQYHEGCAAALEYRILGRPIPTRYAAGSCEADAWAAGIEEGHAIWRATLPDKESTAAPAPAELALLRHWRAMDDRSQLFIGKMAAGQAQDCPRRAPPALRLISGGPQ